MKIYGIALAASITLAPMSAYATDWFVEMAGNGTCNAFPLGAFNSPDDIVNWQRAHGQMPNIVIHRGDDGQIQSVTDDTADSSGQDKIITFFTSMDGCQTHLKNDIAAGVAVPQNALQ